MNSNEALKISGFIITKNEEKNIRRALESIKWLDEIIIVDGHSTDDTCKIAEKYNAKIINSKFAGFDAEKNKAIKACRHDWILEIDADEELEKGAESELKQAALNKDVNGYSLRRPEYYLGKLILNPRKIRFYRNQGFFYKNYTHERLQIDGKIDKLSSQIFHYSNISVADHISSMNKLSDQEVDKRFREQKNIYPDIKLIFLCLFNSIFILGVYLIYYRLLFKGFVGITYAFMGAFHEMNIMMKYYERKHTCRDST